MLHRSGNIYRFAGASDADVQQAHFLNNLASSSHQRSASIRRTRAYTSSFAPRTNRSRPIETRNARNENGAPLEPLSGVNGHHRDICIKVIGETPQGALGEDTNDIVEALRRAHRDVVIIKVFPQRSKKHVIGPPILESPGAIHQFIRDGVYYFVRSRPADALSLDAISVILENENALNAINSGGHPKRVR